MKMVPDQDNPAHRDGTWKPNISHYPRKSDIFTASSIRRDIQHQLEMVRSLEEPHETLLSGRPYFSGMALDNGPVSPRQVPIDDRRPSLHAVPPRPNFFRPPVPPHLAIAPRRYGSIGGANPSPAYHRPSIAQQTPQTTQHPLASVCEPGPGPGPGPGPNLARRHTSADIRIPAAWPPQAGSPFESGQSSTPWPSSPQRTPNPGDQQVRDVLAQYELGGPRRTYDSRQPTPPATNDSNHANLAPESTWTFGGSKFAPRLLDSAPQTRRSSMASNVHSLLNPAETVERDEDEPMTDDRKRKRLQ